MKPVAIAAACALAALPAAACGGGDAEDEGGAARPLAAELVVSVRPAPDRPAKRRTIRCERLGAGAEPCSGLGGLTAEQLAPVPATTACTQVYGGDATARVTGRVQGKRVDARFELTDGCEIERWDRNRVLLGDPPGP